MNIFTCTEYFNEYKYKVEISTEERSKSIRFWVGLTSGKKRKELNIYEDKKNKSLGGIKALLWAKKAILAFPNYFKEKYVTDDVKLYICIHWADSRRRDIYQRLERDGFYFSTIDGNKTLIKKV